MRDYLKNQYKEIGAYLKRNRAFLLIIGLVIIEVIVYGTLKAKANTGYEEYVAEAMPSYPNLFTFIFLENLKSSGKTLLAGLVPFYFGSLTILILTILGLAATMKQLLFSYPLYVILLSVLPHGVFEFSAMIGAVLFSSLLSKEITLWIVQMIVPKGCALWNKINDHRIKNILTVIKGWCFVVVPLLLVAAVMEVTISSMVLELVMM